MKMVLVLHKRADLSREEFSRHWREVHAPLIAKLPGYRRAVLNHALPDPSGEPPAFDGIGETWFESAAALQAALASPEAQAVAADGQNFLDMSKLRIVVVDEEAA